MDRTTFLGAALLALTSVLYLFFGIAFTAGNLFFPATLASHCGYTVAQNDATQLIHLAAGGAALGLAWAGLAGLRAWLAGRHYARVFAAIAALTSFSCMFGLMPTGEQTVLTVLGVALMGVSMLAFLVVLTRAVEREGEDTSDGDFDT